MNKKETASKKEIKYDTKNSNTSGEKSIYVDPNIGRQDGTSSYPFYTPPGEGPQPRITSN